MPSTSGTEVGFIALVVIHVDGPATQRTLVDMLARDVEAWVRHCPGFVSANYHLAVDGTQVVNYAEWASETAYRQSFDLNPDKKAMRDAIRELPGVIDGPKMTGFVTDRRIVANDAASGGEIGITADLVRRGVMQLGSRLRLEHPAEMPAPDELNTLVALTNHGPASLHAIAERIQRSPGAVETTIATLTSAALVEGPVGDQRLFRISAKGQSVLDEGRRIRNEWLAAGMTALDFTSQERESLGLSGRLMERLSKL